MTTSEQEKPFSDQWWSEFAEGGTDVLDKVFGKAVRSGGAAAKELANHIKRLALAERRLREVQVILDRRFIEDDERVAAIRAILVEPSAD